MSLLRRWWNEVHFFSLKGFFWWTGRRVARVIARIVAGVVVGICVVVVATTSRVVIWRTVATATLVVVFLGVSRHWIDVVRG